MAEKGASLTQRIAEQALKTAEKSGGDEGTVARASRLVPDLQLNPRSAADVKTAESILKAHEASTPPSDQT